MHQQEQQQPAQDSLLDGEAVRQIEGRFQCSMAGRKYEYLASYVGERSVDWHATIRCGYCFSWFSGTLSHNTHRGAQLEQAVRAHVLAAIALMDVCREV
ncbi:hypothetical protein J8I26_06250 [Herbaspirillum sp. LeCh32-8]|uniref:hypothetical protein n=1 Tax=Herbaspirillum sp. LeCh32-8 TaxID=2821356 RepID=UPI001AE3C6DA|nr:hypothetical protein [Herbaspirillum sp. LeCh32-8]MBP0597695.1 hypothetical protein [Herbaspirillum sp. LeCh32-8]